MKKIIPLVFICVALCAFRADEQPLNKLKWLTGKWQIENEETYEEWRVVNDTLMSGNNYRIENKQTIPNEYMTVVVKGGQLYYMPTAIGQNDGKAVSFKITAVSPGYFRAENATHDFPQKIVYELKDQNHLYAFIEGNMGGKRRKIAFNFVRVTGKF